MNSNKNVSSWLNENLSEILSFPVPPDLTEYILTIENDRDLEDYMKTLLDLSNPKHKAFVEKFKIQRHADDRNDSENEKFKGGAKKKKETTLDGGKGDGKLTEKNLDLENKGSTKSKKKNKFVNLYSEEGAKRDVILLKGRHPCECQASKHKLVNNCLKCGRIVCTQEGSGPCLFCGTLVCSIEEQNILNANTNQSKKLYDTLMKSSGGLEKALAQRNKLLEFDRTNAQCSKVIDDESDYFSSNSSWLTKEEREKLKKKEEEQHAKKHMPRSAKKYTLDLLERRVVEEEDQHIETDDSFYRDILEESKAKSVEGYTHPDFQDIFQPIFVSDKKKENCDIDIVPLENQNLDCKVQDKELLLISDKGACLSMHQPWASLLVAGIKKHEGRTWYTSHRGRLWIASASKLPSPEIIKDCETFYKEFYGDDNINFPTSYPVSCLLGCVSLVDCLPQEEYRTVFPNGESESPFVFVCEDFQELDIKFPISGSHKIYKLESRIHQAAKKALLRMARQRKT